MFVAIMVNTVLNFLMSVYAFYMLEKISRAEWSFERKDCKVAKQTTQMDRAVAGGWFDRKMPIKDYQFVNFYHNIPRCSESLDSDRSSNISSSHQSSNISLRSSINDPGSLLIIPGDSLSPRKTHDLKQRR